jgi:hypothetical protein
VITYEEDTLPFSYRFFLVLRRGSLWPLDHISQLIKMWLQMLRNKARFGICNQSLCMADFLPTSLPCFQTVDMILFCPDSSLLTRGHKLSHGSSQFFSPLAGTTFLFKRQTSLMADDPQLFYNALLNHRSSGVSKQLESSLSLSLFSRWHSVQHQ